MKVLRKKVQLVYALLPAFLLSACAAQPSQEPAGPSSFTDQYMYYTDRIAQDRMATVYWINPPKRKIPAKTDDDS